MQSPQAGICTDDESLWGTTLTRLIPLLVAGRSGGGWTSDRSASPQVRDRLYSRDIYGPIYALANEPPTRGSTDAERERALIELASASLRRLREDPEESDDVFPQVSEAWMRPRVRRAM